MEPERIEFERSGGYANIPLRAELTAGELDPPERAALDALLAREPATEARAGAPDRFQYDITVGPHHVQLGERDVDEILRPLIDRLERAAAPEAGQS
jgi:anti-sigma factor RsiW